MKLFIPFLGKRKAYDDDFWEDVDELARMTERTIIGPTNWATGPPKPGEAKEDPNAIVMGRPRPEPGKEADPEPVKETLRQKRLRLKAEVEELEREKKESSKND